MSENPSLPQTETLVPPPPPSRPKSTGFGGQPPSRPRSTAFGNHPGQPRRFSILGHILVGVWAATAAIATASQNNDARFLERQMQTQFFQMRGPVAPPKDVVILAVDQSTWVQGTQFYASDPKKYAYLKPVERFPLKRSAYAIAIDRLMSAGARTVALDFVLDAPSSYSPKDDQQLRRVLQKYAGRVTLAAIYEREQDESLQSDLIQPSLPNPIFQTNPGSIGYVNYPISADKRFHLLGNQFLQLEAQTYPEDVAAEFLRINQGIPSFAEATLKAARTTYAPPKGQNIFFYGGDKTFSHIPFWQILDPETWNELAKDGAFKDKIVLIGPTTEAAKDFHPVPFSDRMAGVEVNANAIATLMENKSIAEAIPNPTLRGLAVLGIIISAAFLQNAVLALGSTRRLRSQLKGSLLRFILAAGIVRFATATALALAWGMIGYIAFVGGGLILPTAIPMAAIALSGISYFVTASASDYRSKLHLLKILGQFPNSEVVQKILSEYVEFQDLLQEPQQQVFGKKLNGRYKITKVLGSGGFGKTYIAEDLYKPGNPLFVVKQLKPASDNPNLLKLARRLFNREAQALQDLGTDDQIPGLEAYFEEEGEFYLVQEFIRGKPLSTELSLPGRQLPEARVVAILQDLLQILKKVHAKGVIHRDIKPSNIIWRESDGKLVLIDFGAVKISEPQEENDDQSDVTVGIGTKGYMPTEQSSGKPRPNSDVYAVGMIGIQALTGLFPSKLKERLDPHSGEIQWREKARVSQAFADILDGMVRYDYRSRYQSAIDVLKDLEKLPVTPAPLPADEATMPPILAEDADNSIAEATQPWPETFGSASDLPNTEIPPQEPSE
ncbi:CHASE2 domain-containing protein [Kovacikia minuta CCNUW1]|uniref:serine/threonine-protein kinase n=1 Tax=Kovacikia minuta TaxID=2931930 RepID=UPI001CCD7780|nr:serine/threonine-protein kinase [Kovacikia minuta]UBF25302.1 CHASE2 domain-containing protein [Kovacikia minuta CCNUW1]